MKQNDHPSVRDLRAPAQRGDRRTDLARREHGPGGWPGAYLHPHNFDETFYVLEGELTFQLEAELATARGGDVVLAPRNVPHTLANRSDSPARYVLICNPAGFERSFARMAAEQRGVAPPDWAQKPSPEVVRVGPRIGDSD